VHLRRVIRDSLGKGRAATWPRGECQPSAPRDVSPDWVAALARAVRGWAAASRRGEGTADEIWKFAPAVDDAPAEERERSRRRLPAALLPFEARERLLVQVETLVEGRRSASAYRDLHWMSEDALRRLIAELRSRAWAESEGGASAD
jgi:hypothetical protein